MMSDPVSNTEIEDVLSSIRRLISADGGGAPGAAAARGQEQQDEPAAAAKLVLTPSHMVSAPEDAKPATPAPGPVPTAEAAAEPVPQPLSLRPVGPAERGPKGRRINPGPFGDSEDDSRPIPVPSFIHREPPSETPRGLEPSLEDRIAELEAALGQQMDEWEPDGSEYQAQQFAFPEDEGGDAALPSFEDETESFRAARRDLGLDDIPAPNDAEDPSRDLFTPSDLNLDGTPRRKAEIEDAEVVETAKVHQFIAPRRGNIDRSQDAVEKLVSDVLSEAMAEVTMLHTTGKGLEGKAPAKDDAPETDESVEVSNWSDLDSAPVGAQGPEEAGFDDIDVRHSDVVSPPTLDLSGFLAPEPLNRAPEEKQPVTADETEDLSDIEASDFAPDEELSDADFAEIDDTADVVFEEDLEDLAAIDLPDDASDEEIAQVWGEAVQLDEAEPEEAVAAAEPDTATDEPLWLGQAEQALVEPDADQAEGDAPATVSDAMAEVPTPEDRLTALEDDLEEIETGLTEAAEDLAETEDALAELDEELTEVEAEFAELEDDLAEAEEDLAEITDDLGEAEEDVAEIADDLGEAQEELAEIADDLGEAEEELAEIADDLGEAEEELAEIADDLDEAEEELAEIADDLSEAEEELAAIEDAAPEVLVLGEPADVDTPDADETRLDEVAQSALDEGEIGWRSGRDHSDTAPTAPSEISRSESRVSFAPEVPAAPQDLAAQAAPMAAVASAGAPAATGTELAADVAMGTLEEAPIIDEAALREIVSDIVRSELQGELGERITRNVRKLIRREIYQALASREFD